MLIRRSLCVVVLVAISSCAIIAPTARPAAVEVNAMTMGNGHLLEISAGRSFGPVTALLTPDRWLIVTIVDTLLTPGDLRSFRALFVDSVDVVQFPTALQIAFRITVPVEAVEVVHEDPGPVAQISLFRHTKPR